MTRLLLDTHALLWWLAGDERLSTTAREAISEELDPIFVSAASIWEIATKHRLGKLPAASPIVGDLAGVIESQGFVGLPITVRHGARCGRIAGAASRSFRSHADRPGPCLMISFWFQMSELLARTARACSGEAAQPLHLMEPGPRRVLLEGAKDLFDRRRNAGSGIALRPPDRVAAGGGSRRQRRDYFDRKPHHGRCSGRGWAGRNPDRSGRGMGGGRDVDGGGRICVRQLAGRLRGR